MALSNRINMRGGGSSAPEISYLFTSQNNTMTVSKDGVSQGTMVPSSPSYVDPLIEVSYSSNNWHVKTNVNCKVDGVTTPANTEIITIPVANNVTRSALIASM